MFIQSVCSHLFCSINTSTANRMGCIFSYKVTPSAVATAVFLSISPSHSCLNSSLPWDIYSKYELFTYLLLHTLWRGVSPSLTDGHFLFKVHHNSHGASGSSWVFGDACNYPVSRHCLVKDKEMHTLSTSCALQKKRPGIDPSWFSWWRSCLMKRLRSNWELRPHEWTNSKN